MRKAFGLVLAAALLAPFSSARAADVLHFKSDGKSANAIVDDPATGASTAIFVSREDVPGKPVYRIFYVVSGPDVPFALGSGLLPAGSFSISAKNASLDVDMNDVAFDFQVGEIPDDSIISIDWHATGVERVSGNTFFEFPGGRAIFTGTSTNMPASVVGDVFGVPLVNPTGSMMILHQSAVIQTF